MDAPRLRMILLYGNIRWNGVEQCGYKHLFNKQIEQSSGTGCQAPVTLLSLPWRGK